MKSLKRQGLVSDGGSSKLKNKKFKKVKNPGFFGGGDGAKLEG